MRVGWGGMAAVVAVLGVAACASPDPKLYTLAATVGVVLPAAGTVAELHPVDVPGYLDRPEMVRRTGDYRVHLANNERWSEPFGNLVQHVLREDLDRRLSGAVVYTDASALSAKATVTVELDITRLEEDGAGSAVLDGTFSVIGAAADGGDAASVSRPVHLTTPAGADSTAYAASLSALVGQLADAIAGAAMKLPAPAPLPVTAAPGS